MAKFKMKTEMIAPLKAAGIVSAENILKIRIPHRVQNSLETMYELEIDVTEAIETDNRRAAATIAASRSPRLQVGGSWIAGDPDVLWFDELPEEDTTTTKQPHVHGTEILTKHQRKVIRAYVKATGAEVPRSVVKAEMQEHLTAAVSHFAAE